MRMRLFVLIVLTCHLAMPVQAAEQFGIPFTMVVGETVEVGGDGLTVGFDAVPADSRCPSNVLCVWAGDAAVDLWLQPLDGDRSEFTLHTHWDFTRSVRIGEHLVALLLVYPYPVLPRQITQDDYVVTVRVDLLRQAPADPSSWGRLKSLYD